MRDSFAFFFVPPENHDILAVMPISRGAYSVDDFLVVMDSLAGARYVLRVESNGTILSKSEMVPTRDDALALAWRMIVDQGERNCTAVSGGGRWGNE
jgi:hypothetical protein